MDKALNDGFSFADKNQKPLRMSRMQIAKQAVAILSLILVMIMSKRCSLFFHKPRSFVGKELNDTKIKGVPKKFPL